MCLLEVGWKSSGSGSSSDLSSSSLFGTGLSGLPTPNEMQILPSTTPHSIGGLPIYNSEPELKSSSQTSKSSSLHHEKFNSISFDPFVIQPQSAPPAPPLYTNPPIANYAEPLLPIIDPQPSLMIQKAMPSTFTFPPLPLTEPSPPPPPLPPPPPPTSQAPMVDHFNCDTLKRSACPILYTSKTT